MFITFEGIDGSGKTTQLNLLAEKLQKDGYNILLTKQPGGSQIGQQIRKILLQPTQDYTITPTAELLLYLADRIQHLQEIIEPALKQKKIVLCDRFHDSTIAYQAGGRRLNLDWLQPFTQKLIRQPDLTLWFDLTTEEALERMEQRVQISGILKSRFDQEHQDFHDRVRSAYSKLWQLNPTRIQRINASQTKTQVFQKVYQLINQQLQ